MPSPHQNQMKRQHIFAVNGSPDFLDLIRLLFQEEDFNVTTTNFVPDTFEQITAAKPDLLLVDLVVGQEAGLELLEHLGTGHATQRIPLIVTSTSQRLLDEVQIDPDRYRGQGFLSKPFDLDDLLAMVAALVGPA